MTVLDMEASLEHLARGTVRHADVLLVVTEPYYRSLETTGRLVPLARDLGIKHVWVVANKVRSDRDGAAIREYCERHGFSLEATIPFDDAITAADQTGRSLIDVAPESPAVAAIEELADTLVVHVGGSVTA